MKITVKKTSLNKNTWEGVDYPVVCKHIEKNLIAIAYNNKRGTIFCIDDGKVIANYTLDNPTWKAAGYFPCTEPVTITLEN